MTKTLTMADYDFMMKMWEVSAKDEHDLWLLEMAEKIKNTLGEEKEPEKQVASIWKLELSYKHRAFKTPRFEDLGEFESVDYDTAYQKAKELGQLMVEQTLEEADVEHWEVRVRPASSQKC